MFEESKKSFLKIESQYEAFCEKCEDMCTYGKQCVCEEESFGDGSCGCEGCP